jgi:hypothetical protein
MTVFQVFAYALLIVSVLSFAYFFAGYVTKHGAVDMYALPLSILTCGYLLTLCIRRKEGDAKLQRVIGSKRKTAVSAQVIYHRTNPA